MLKRFTALTTACAMLFACDTAPPPDQYGYVRQMREVAIEDAENSGSGGLSGCCGSGAAGLIVLGAILVIVGTAAIVDAISDHDLHARKALLYDVTLPSGDTLNLLQDEKAGGPLLTPGQWVVLHYGKGDPKEKNCFEWMKADTQGHPVLRIKSCDFVKRKPSAP